MDIIRGEMAFWIMNGECLFAIAAVAGVARAVAVTVKLRSLYGWKGLYGSLYSCR